jgi:hypothetical protein
MNKVLFFTAALALLPSSVLGDEVRSIKAGMDFDEVKGILAKHHCDIGDCNNRDVITPKFIRVECGTIDDEILLSVAFDERTKKVTALSVEFIPQGHSPKRYRVYRTASRIAFDDNDSVTLSLIREIGKHKAKPVPDENPFK